MRVHKIHLFILCCICLTLSSCFNISEDISLTKKGSGSYAIGIDMSPALSALSLVLPVEGLTLDQVLSKMDLLDFSIMDQLKGMTGVHDVKFSSPQKFNYKLSMNFDDVNALNRIGQTGDNGISKADQFILKGTKLSRKSLDFDINNTKVSKAKKYMNMPIVKDLMNSTKFVTTYHLPGNVKKIQNKKAVISGDGKVVVLENSMHDLLDKNAFNDITIKFKKK